MVVAAAAPLGVIGGLVPLGIASGNGAGFPATFIVATIVLLSLRRRLHRDDPVRRGGGRLLLLRRHRPRLPTGIGIALLALVSYLAIEAGVYGLLGPAGATSSHCSAARRAVVARSRPWLRRHDVLGYRNIELSSRVLAVLLIAEIAIVLVLDLVIVAARRPRGLLHGHRRPERDLLRLPRHRPAVRDAQLHRLRGDRDLPRRGQGSRRTIPRATYRR